MTFLIHISGGVSLKTLTINVLSLHITFISELFRLFQAKLPNPKYMPGVSCRRRKSFEICTNVFKMIWACLIFDWLPKIWFQRNSIDSNLRNIPSMASFDRYNKKIQYWLTLLSIRRENNNQFAKLFRFILWKKNN